MEVHDQTPDGVRVTPHPPQVRPQAESAAGPPPLRVLPWLHVTSFVREELERCTRLTLTGELRVAARPPKDLALILRHGGVTITRDPVTSELERAPGLRGRHERLSLTVTFEVPPVLDWNHGPELELLARSRRPLRLPMPARAPAPSASGLRAGIGAVASAAALGATTILATPAGALAAAGSGVVSASPAACASGTGPSTTGATATTSGSTTSATSSTSSTGSTSSATCTPGTGSSTTTRVARTSTTKSSENGASKSSGTSATKRTRKPSAAEKKNQLTETSSSKHRSRHRHQQKLYPLPPVPISSTGGAYLSSAQWGGGSLLPAAHAEMRVQHFVARARHATHPPKQLVKRFRQAGRRYHLPWEALAAISYVETGYKGGVVAHEHLVSRSLGASGWARVMPATWADYSQAVQLPTQPTHHRVGNPALSRGAIFSTAHRLVADGAHKDLARAVFRYHHARRYVQEVLTVAERIAANHIGHQQPQRRLAAMETMAHLLNGLGYTWGGGHTSSHWTVQVGYDCSGFVSAVLRAGGYLRTPQTTQTLPHQPSIARGLGRWVTIFDRTNAGTRRDHVIIDLNGRFWEEGGSDSMVHRMLNVSQHYLQTFNVVLHPQGL